MTKITVNEYRTELENQILTANPIQDDINGTDYQFEMSEKEELEYMLSMLNDPEEEERMLACRNCKNNQMCDFCSYGSNLPPN